MWNFIFDIGCTQGCQISKREKRKIRRKKRKKAERTLAKAEKNPESDISLLIRMTDKNF